jgi:hypothetical protein
MVAVMSSPAADFQAPMGESSVDELEAAIGRLVCQMNSECYRMLVLVREFDDRFGWKKWSSKTCAEWLAWRSDISLSAAREKIRTAHALRSLPAISAAFEQGRLSYSKVRALTRVAHRRDEDLLLAYALNATVARVEERCRQIRNVAPESAHHARRAWGARSLTMWRDDGRGVMRFTVEVPIEEGELIVRALDCAVAAGEVTTDVDPESIAESKGTAWCAQQADALVAVAKSYLDGGHGHESGARSLPSRRARRRAIPHARGGASGSADRHRETAAVRLQHGVGHRRRIRKPARRRPKAKNDVDAAASSATRA